jgi:anti-sigma B factor antagonist
MTLSILMSRAGGQRSVGVLRLNGEVDIATSETLRQHLAALRDDGYQNVVLDLSGVTFCDSTGLGTVATHAKRLMESGGKLVVAGLRPDVSAVFDISGLSQAIPIAESVPKAVALAGEDGPS